MRMRGKKEKEEKKLSGETRRKKNTDSQNENERNWMCFFIKINDPFPTAHTLSSSQNEKRGLMRNSNQSQRRRNGSSLTMRAEDGAG